jgi:hypothetical protein
LSVEGSIVMTDSLLEPSVGQPTCFGTKYGLMNPYVCDVGYLDGELSMDDSDRIVHPRAIVPGLIEGDDKSSRNCRRQRAAYDACVEAHWPD